MLIGEFETSLGDKNRIAIPKKLRESLKGDLVLTRGYEECLLLLDKARWLRLIEEFNKRPLLSLDVRDTKRYILSGASIIEPDSQGRFVLSEALKKFANISEKLVFLGVGEWIEIWDLDKWNEKLIDLSSKVSDIAERLN